MAAFAGCRSTSNLMQGLGIVMMLLFLHLYFAPWRRFRAAVARQDWAEGGRQLGQIRTIVTINLVLGLIVVAIGGSGRYWRLSVSARAARTRNDDGSMRRSPAFIFVAPSGEIQVALSPPSSRRRKRSVLSPFCANTSSSPSIRPLRRLHSAGSSLSMPGPIA